MNLKACLVDFYGTIVHDVGLVIHEVSLEIKSATPIQSVSVEEVSLYWWNQFYHLFNKCTGIQFQTQREIEIESLRRTLIHFQAPLDAQSLGEKMFEQWRRPAIYQDAIYFLNKVKLPIFIVSNIDRVEIMEALDYHGLEVDGVVTSEDVLSYKPKGKIYEEALQLTQCKKEEVVYIGDTLTIDVAGAIDIGMKTIWVNRTKQTHPVSIKPTITVNDLYDAVSHLEAIEVT
ncbi:HAD family hydrolase [Alkalihalobacillus pseudalcaliphilus]|uniref:HAD family hydrolase n=1 Tax=Alkalihalobacillus pseudalcaliphilus TaxID=79884 RepID=UPI00069F7B28|nr:HAD family hydrolase [Alkalihalobacillus pseudalcaliphilus]